MAQEVSNVGLLIAAFAGAAGCFAAARRRDRYRRAWLFLGAACAAWGCGQVVWTWYESRGREMPFPSYADVGYLCLPPLAAVGLLVLPSATQSLAGRIRTVIDGLMIAGAVLLCSWVAVLDQVYAAGGDSLGATSISLAYPLGDVVLITIGLYVLLRTRENRQRAFPVWIIVAGLFWRFAFDSDAELYKLARHAPGSAVYLRVRVDDSTSVFPLSHKFGVEPEQARSLMSLARRLGLHPYGVTFHVGSQCTETGAWEKAIAAIGRMLEDLQADSVHLDFLNISGGFPARYAEPVPSIDEIGSVIAAALDDHLPYLPAQLAAEPGRFVVAESAVIVASVLGREVRAGESWVYLDVGAYNGLIETKQTANAWRYPLWSSRGDHSSAPHDLFTVTGPTCDSSDTLFIGMPLPSTIEVGDHVYIGSTGAYTLSYASSFNGFPPPSVVYVGEP